MPAGPLAGMKGKGDDDNHIKIFLRVRPTKNPSSFLKIKAKQDDEALLDPQVRNKVSPMLLFGKISSLCAL